VGFHVNTAALSAALAIRPFEHSASPTAGNNIASRCLKREATPEDLTGALIFLAAADSDFMTGQTIVVDGGSVTH